MKNKIIALTLGIRYSRSFRILDISGSVIDDILYDESSPFHKRSFFSRIVEGGARDKILQDENGERMLRINTDDLIISFKVNENIDDEISWLKNEVIPYYEKNIFLKYQIKNIKRVGLIFHHKLTKNSKLENIVGTLTNDEIKKAENINFSFSKKLPTVVGANFKGVNDYDNAIFNIKQINTKMIAELDYQRYYEPILEDIRECKISGHINQSYKYLTDEYYKWLKLYE